MTTPLNTSILITGGAGFLGSALCHRLNQLGYDQITLVDRLGKTDKWRNLVGLKYRTYIELSEFDKYLQTPFKIWDVIFHMGACSSTREQDASYLMRNNYESSLILATYAQKHEIRFIYASSAATYGAGPMDDKLPPHSLKPRNPYALSKNMFDQYAARAGWLDSMVGLKFFNVYGSNSRHKGVMQDFVAKTYDQIKATGKVTLYDTYKTAPDGKDARDFLYVKDAVDMAIHFAFGRGKEASGLFNIGSGVATRWVDVALEVLDALDIQIKMDAWSERIVYTPLPPDLAPKYQYYTQADITRLRASGYDAPITPIDAAIKDYVQNYLTPDLRLGERQT